VLEVTVDGDGDGGRDGDRDGSRDGDDGDSVGWEVNGRDIVWIVMER
jgi:hypothetical protein